MIVNQCCQTIVKINIAVIELMRLLGVKELLYMLNIKIDG